MAATAAPQTAGIVQPSTPAAPAANGATPAAPATPAEQFFEFKVDGELKKIPRSEAEKRLSKEFFADKRTQQATEAIAAAKAAEKERAEEKRRLKEETEAYLEAQGIDLDSLARKRLEKRLQQAEMTPEQRAIAERDARIAELEGKTRAAEEERKGRAVAEASKRIQARIEGALDTAWERAGFERGADSFAAVYEVMKEWHELGLLPRQDQFTDSHADRIIEQAKANLEGVDKRREAAVMKGLKGKALYDRLGKTVVDELNRYQIEMHRGGKKTTDVTPQPTKAVSSSSGYMTPAEALESMRKMGK